MIELTNNIGDDRRCSITAWKAEDWQALAMAPGLPQPSRIQDYMRAGKVVGQVHYFLIQELPRLVAWLEITGRTYRLKSFNEVTPPSSELVTARLIRQQQQNQKAVKSSPPLAPKLLEERWEKAADE
jgi:hypothetical protein